jgi:hypothetical protein
MTKQAKYVFRDARGNVCQAPPTSSTKALPSEDSDDDDDANDPYDDDDDDEDGVMKT